MQTFSQALAEAASLILSFDPALLEIVGLSLRVSLLAVAIGALIGLPLGAALAIARFPGRGVLTVLVNTAMGLPPVVVGLVAYLLLSRAGALGPLELLYTPTAMVIAQTVLVTPIIAGLARQTLAEMHAEYHEQLTLMGATARARIAVLLWDARFALITALLAGFGRASAEVGAVLMVGGNINHYTRVMTTTIAMETAKGNLTVALGLGIVLLLIAFSVNALVHWVRNHAERTAYA
ncbi:MAG: ABC transporter permease [Pseudomonadota bacterium]